MPLQITPEQLAAALAVQVKRQVNAVAQQKANIPTMKANLATMIARPDVIAALGDDLADVQAAVAAL